LLVYERKIFLKEGEIMKSLIFTKMWFEKGERYKKICELPATENFEPIKKALAKKEPTDLFFFNRSRPRYVVEIIDDDEQLKKLIQFRGSLMIKDGLWYSVGKEPREFIDNLLNERAKKVKIKWNETLEAKLAEASA